MDKSWMTEPQHSKKYIEGVDCLLDLAFNSGSNVGEEIPCPCTGCKNRLWYKREEVRDHLVCAGIMETYTPWSFHGEDYRSRDTTPPIASDPSCDDLFDEQCDMYNLVRDAFGIHSFASEMNEDVEHEECSDDDVNDADIEVESEGEGETSEEDPEFEKVNVTEDGHNEEDLNFFRFFENGSEELYPGSKSTVLAFTVQLMHLKSYYKWSENSVKMLLKFLKQQFPQSNIPQTLYEAKKMTNALGLGYEKIEVCRNNCMLYRGARATQSSCHVCNSSRWQDDDDASGKSASKQVDDCVSGERVNNKKSACKIMRYFPLIPRLQRLYMSTKTSSLMTWHDKCRTKDGLLRHPADSLAWKKFDEHFPEFALDPRNVRLALSSDGINPYGSMSSSYSIWPVILIPYNLPPWMCMKQSSIILSTIIPGKEAPGDKIDIFLQPLIDELIQLWEGVRTYDATSNEYFMMRASLMWTINDFPAYACLSGWSTKGKKACPCCAHMTESQWLYNGRKFCYMSHRRWLDESHRFRGQKQNFDGTEEWRTKPETLSGFDALKQLEGVSFIDEALANEASTSKRKRSRVKSRTNDSLDEPRAEDDNDFSCASTPWKKKSIFFRLPYWEYNVLRHNLDVMHIEKNVCENVLGTLLNIKGKSKDNPNARHDLAYMNIRHTLHGVELPNGKVYFPPAVYAMTRKEKELFLSVLSKVKFPDGYASQISRKISVKDRKLQSLKTHDYHILMQDLLPVALRSCMNKQVTKLIIELSNIFKAICCKTLNVDELDTIKSRAALLLCHMEICFPPSFFTVMVHLVIHLADEAQVSGPVHYRWMFPIERSFKEFKSYVGNKACPEGSIAEGYIAKECHTFCSRYFDGIETIFNRPRRNIDIDPIEREKYLLSSGGTIKGAVEIKLLDELSLAQAHRYVLLHLDEILPYVEEFKVDMIQGNPSKKYANNPSAMQRLVAMKFHEWFKIHVSRLGNENVPERIRQLSEGPSAIVRTFKCFVFNGIMFRTKNGSKGKKTQNYGVAVTSATPSIASSRDPNLLDGEVEYFGELTEIIELNYSGKFMVILFRCDWADTTRGKGVKKDDLGFTLVNFTRLSHTGERITHEPYVIPSQVQQVFYVPDPSNPPWHVVIKTIPRDIYSLGVEGESIVEGDDEDIEDMTIGFAPYEIQELEESDWVRGDILEDLLSDVVQQL